MIPTRKYGKPSQAARPNKRLIELREAAGMTQEQAAEALHMSRAAYANWETGRRTPRVSNLIRLSDLYNVSIESLLVAEGA